MSDTEAQPFPDLRKFTDPEGLERWYSPAATSQATCAHYAYDSKGGVWMMPYVQVDRTHVYGDPHAILVGRVVQAGFGIDPEPGWKSVVESCGYSKDVAKVIEQYLAARPPISWDKEPDDGPPQT